MKSFASDNWSGVCPEIMEALTVTNAEHIPAYGELEDPITLAAEEKFNAVFGTSVKVFFVYNGTAANVLGVQHLMRPYEAIVTAHSSHMNEDECGAPEKISGSKIYPIETTDGKITADDVNPFLRSVGFQHHSQPKVISISQVTEMGTVYSPEEIAALADFAHHNNLYLHVDGARIANAAVALGISFKEMITDTGVDVLSFGGTKNGLMFGEAVVFLKPKLAHDFEYSRKQGMQLHSKMRFIAAQFNRYLTHELWKQNATTANSMARLLADELDKIPQAKVTRAVKANGVFVLLPESITKSLQQHYYFHVWNYDVNEVRLMCSWDTTEGDVVGFVSALKKALGASS
ncbi:MAG: threonine aldolase [Bacteroidetes bacterium]|nr:MAG: threonine aldolase [Bacteroidota bacterium]